MEFASYGVRGVRSLKNMIYDQAIRVDVLVSSMENL